MDLVHEHLWLRHQIETKSTFFKYRNQVNQFENWNQIWPKVQGLKPYFSLTLITLCQCELIQVIKDSGLIVIFYVNVVDNLQLILLFFLNAGSILLNSYKILLRGQSIVGKSHVVQELVKVTMIW